MSANKVVASRALSTKSEFVVGDESYDGEDLGNAKDEDIEGYCWGDNVLYVRGSD